MKIADYYRNRADNAQNPYQGDRKRVLCICSAGLLRSPTAAYVLSQEPYGFNTRACGVSPIYALIHLDDVLLGWAQEIVCMSEDHKKGTEEALKELGLNTPVYNLDIADSYAYRDPELEELIRSRYDKIVLDKA